MVTDRKNLVIDTFNGFKGTNLSYLDFFYNKEVIFIDPTHKIKGLDELKNYYQRIYKNVDFIQFEFIHFIENKSYLSAEWTMTLKVGPLNFGKAFKVQGASFFEFNEENLVVFHRDYFDLGEMLYEKIPGFGSLVKAIRSRL